MYACFSGSVHKYCVYGSEMLLKFYNAQLVQHVASHCSYVQACPATQLYMLYHLYVLNETTSVSESYLTLSNGSCSDPGIILKVVGSRYVRQRQLHMQCVKHTNKHHMCEQYQQL
jgi:hypothetical protein